MNSGKSVLRSFERTLKLFLSSFLRLLLGSNTLSVPLPRDYKSILVIRQHNQLGDMLCVVPLLRALRKAFPSTHIALIASPVNAEIMLHNRYIDELIVYDKRAYLERHRIRVSRLLEFIRSLRQRRFELAVVPSTVSTSFTSDLLAYISGAPTRIGAGSINGVQNHSSFFFNVPVDLDWRDTPHRHQTLRNFDVAHPLGIYPDDCTIEMTLIRDELDGGKSFIMKTQDRGPLVVALHPGAGKPPNRWPAPSFTEVANRLAEGFGAHLLVTSGPMDDDPVGVMVKGLRPPFQLIKNQPIRKVASILSHVDLLISNDTGIMHVGAAVGIPVLSIFGPTDAQQWAPLGKRDRCLIAEDGNIATVTVEDVLRNAQEMLLEFAGRVS